MSEFLNMIIYLIMICEFSKSSSLLQNNLIDKVVDKILKLNLHQVSFFHDHKILISNFTEFNSIHEKISRKVSTFVINFNDKYVFNSSSELKNTRTALNSDLYVQLEYSHRFNVQKIEQNLRMISELNPSPPRAKFLLILIGDSVSMHNHFKHLFSYTWEMKFLDFSMLIIHDNVNSIIIHYNSFFETCNRQDLSSGKLFSDKFENMYGHKIKMILFENPPHTEYAYESDILIVDGVNYGFWNLMSLIGPIFYIKDDSSKSEINVSIMMYSSMTASIVLVTMALVRLFKLEAEVLSPLNVFALLFGITVDKIPMKFFEKLIYISLDILSIQYSSDINR